jgi:hypothetical protein
MLRKALPAGFVIGLIGLTAAPAGAQEGWRFAVSPYVWLPGLTTSVGTPEGTVDIDTSASDAVADLNFAFMAAVEARKDRWSLILDYIYSDISMSEDTPLGLFWSSGEVDTKMTVFTTYAGYRVFENDRAFVEVLGGGRFYWLDVDLTLEPRLLSGRTFDLSGNWADPVLGARARYDFTDRWFGTALADYGGFGGGSDESWQALATVGYQFNPSWSVQGGWRYLATSKELEGIDVEVDLNGAILGFTYRF